MTKLLFIGLGGFLGAIARYSLGGLVHQYYRGSLPLGTLVVNVLGCLAIGLVMFLVEERQALAPQARLFLTVGLLGALTTFSAFGYETLQLMREGQLGSALLSVLANVILGLAAVWGGWQLARILS